MLVRNCSVVLPLCLASAAAVRTGTAAAFVAPAVHSAVLSARHSGVVASRHLQTWSGDVTRRDAHSRSLNMFGSAPAPVPVTVDMVKDVSLQRVTVTPATDTANATASVETPAIAAGSLWAASPAVVFVVRRPGCPLCREQAMELMGLQPRLEAVGVKLVAVTHQMLDVEEFKTDYFQEGDVYMDEKRAFFEALGDRWSGLSGMLRPSFFKAAMRVRKKPVKGTMAGEGRLLGGLLVVGAGDRGVVYEHREATFGDHAPLEEVMAAAGEAAGKPEPVAAPVPATTA